MRKQVDVLSSHHSLFNFDWICVFQFVFDRRGFRPGHWSSARPMGGRQGDPASHCGKLVFACVTMTLSALCVLWEALALHPHPWEAEVRQARERCWEHPRLSPSLCHSSTTNINTTLGEGLAYMSQPHPWTLSHHCLPCVSMATGRNKQSLTCQKRQKEMILFFFIHLNVSLIISASCYLLMRNNKYIYTSQMAKT